MAKRPWRAQEDSIAYDFSGRRVARSGAGTLKGDDEILATAREWWMVEAKQTSAERVKIETLWWERLCYDSAHELKLPMLMVESKGLDVALLSPEDLGSLFVKAGSEERFHARNCKANMHSFSFTASDWSEFCRVSTGEPVWRIQFPGFVLCMISRKTAISLFKRAYGKGKV